jgi:hypothetical protein
MSGKAYHDTMMQRKKAIDCPIATNYIARRCGLDSLRGVSSTLNQKRRCYSSRDMDIVLRNSHAWNQVDMRLCVWFSVFR